MLNWRQLLGLLQMPLDESGSHYILLNGHDGNFCFRDGPVALDYARSVAWSTDVGHYLAFENGSVISYDWRKRDPDIYTRTKVENNIENFYEELKKNQSSRGASVVAFSIGVLRRIRSMIGEEENAMNSLRLLLAMFAASSDDSSKESINYESWGLGNDTKAIVETLSTSDWNLGIEHIRNGSNELQLKLNIPLMLKHASGPLFEEAHRQAIVTRQLSMFGLPDAASSFGGTRGFGVHYTPAYLVRSLVEEALLAIEKQGNLTIFDPACGSGEFLKEAVKQLRLTGYAGAISLIGWDLSEMAVSMAQFNLLSMREQNVQIEIIKKDALAQASVWPMVDLVLMNPPFVSLENMSAVQQEALRRILGNSYTKRPDMSSAFIFKGAESLNDKGVIGCVIPSSLISGESHASLRKALLVDFQLHSTLIAKLGSLSIFTGAIVDTALYVASKVSPKISPTALWAGPKGDSTTSALRQLRKYRITPWSSDVISKEEFSIYPLTDAEALQDIWEPRPYFVFDLAKRLSFLPKASDFFSIHQGIRTGLNRAFLLRYEEWASLPAKEQKHFKPAVVNESINQGILTRAVYCFYPYGKGLTIESEATLRRSLPNYYAKKLLPQKELLQKRARADKRNWWELTEHRAWQIEYQPKLVSTSWGGAGSFAYDERGDFAVVQGHAWLPTPGSGIGPNQELALLALFAAPSFDQLLPLVSNRLQGGQWDLSAKYLDQLPIPNFAGLANSILRELGEFGNHIMKGHPFDVTKLDEMFRELYRY